MSSHQTLKRGQGACNPQELADYPVVMPTPPFCFDSCFYSGSILMIGVEVPSFPAAPNLSLRMIQRPMGFVAPGAEAGT